MSAGVVAVYATVWCAIGAYVYSKWKSRHAALAYLAGALLMLAHVITAMIVVHHGSLDEAYQHVAQRTDALLGLRVGAGIYVNFVFAGGWLIDAAIRLKWGELRYHALPRIVGVIRESFFLFMIASATVLFGSWPAQIMGAVALTLLALPYRRRAHSIN